MKRIWVRQTGAPQVMRFEEGPEPAPGSGQVLVRIHAAGVNPVDAYVRAGSFGYSPQVPYTPGADGAGLIEKLGSNVTAFTVGQRVYGGRSVSGSYAEKATFDQSQVFPLPEKLSFSQGACLGIPYGTAYRAIFQKAKAKAGETILIHGASGGVGLAGVQLAKAAGLTVIGTAGSEPGRHLVKLEGADHVLDHYTAAHLEDAIRLSGGTGVNIVLELLANVNLAADLKSVAYFGRIVVVGSRGTTAIDPRDAMQRDAAIMGMVLKNAPEEEFAQIHQALGRGMAEGKIRPVVGKELPLEEAPKAHELVMQGPAYGNIVLVP